MATTKRPTINLLTVSACVTLLFCIAIGFDISPLLRGPAPYPPEWQWSYMFVNTLSRLWAPLLVGAIGAIGFFYFDQETCLKKRLFSTYVLVFLFLFLFSLQMSVLFFSRAGIGILLERIVHPGINGYFTTAISIKNISMFFPTYQQQVAHFSMRAADHPPFAVLFFWVLLEICRHMQFLFPFPSSLHIHHSDISLLWQHLLPYQKLAAVLSAGSIPLLSAGVVVPLYFFMQRFYDRKTALRASFLYSVFPSISLFLPLNDTFLGLFTMGGFLLVLIGQKNNAWYFYVLSGFFLTIGIFFSISLLVPVLMLFMMVFLMNTATKQKWLGVSGILCGLLVLPGIFAVVFHFNTIGVLVEITSLQAKRSYLPWVFYDFYDFFIFAGVSVLICSIDIVKRQVLSLWNKRNSNDYLAISFFIILFLLDISGLSRAEVGRIWMPYMPLLAGIVAAFLTQQKKLSSKAFFFVLLLQFVQLLVMQEFWVTLW